MKKLFLTISRGSIARNILQNEFYEILAREYELVVLTPAYKDERFLKEFSRPRVRFIDLPHMERSFFDMLLFFFHKYLVYNSTVNQKARWGIIGDPRSKRPFYPTFLLKKLLFTLLCRITVLRDLVRLIDLHFAQQPEVRMWQDILKRERPDLVIALNIADDMEAALLKAGKRLKIRTIGMPKSWDNPNKNGFRVKTDLIVVWNELVAEEMVRFQNYRQDAIKIIGVPQFDYYLDRSRILSRDAFCADMGLDPKKKIILFTSEGKLFKEDGEVASVMYDAIEKKSLSEPCQLLIRPHYGFKKDEEKFRHLFGKPDVVVDLKNEPSACFRDQWDYSRVAMDRFLNTIYHTDIDVNTHSSLTLDVLPFDKPVISIMFDGFVEKPYAKSTRRWYETYYYRKILAFNATSEVQSPQELNEALNAYLLDPSIKREERKRLCDTFSYAFDGKSGERFAEVVRNLVSKPQ